MALSSKVKSIDPFSESFAHRSDETSEYNALKRALKLASGFTLFFVHCNNLPLRRKLISEIKTDLADLNILEFPLEKEITHLLDFFRNKKSDEFHSPDIIFLHGIENWLADGEKGEQSPFILNLNAARNNFPVALPLPIVFWVNERVMTTIARGAPDFCSIRSGIYFFEAPVEKRTDIERILADADQAAVDGLSYEEKIERLETVRKMLNDYESLPNETRDRSTESRLLYNLYQINNSLGNYDEAEKLISQRLKLDRELYGNNSSEVTADLNDLALLLNSKGQNKKAIELIQEALKIDIKLFGESDQSVAIRYNNLGIAYHALGDAAKAKSYYEKALEIDRTVFGEQHPDTATDYNNLGSAYSDLGEPAKSVSYYEKALEIDRSVFGEQHPNIAISYNNLGSAYRDLGDTAKAVSYYEKALEIFKTVYGPEHPNTITVKKNLDATKKMML